MEFNRHFLNVCVGDPFPNARSEAESLLGRLFSAQTSDITLYHEMKGSIFAFWCWTQNNKQQKKVGKKVCVCVFQVLLFKPEALQYHMISFSADRHIVIFSHPHWGPPFLHHRALFLSLEISSGYYCQEIHPENRSMCFFLIPAMWMPCVKMSQMLKTQVFDALAGPAADSDVDWTLLDAAVTRGDQRWPGESLGNPWGILCNLPQDANLASPKRSKKVHR